MGRAVVLPGSPVPGWLQGAPDGAGQRVKGRDAAAPFRSHADYRQETGGAALFYLDFLLKAPHEDLPPELHDGLYHAFPSIAGEDGYSGRAMDLCDRNQVMHYARFALYAAVRAAKALGVDADLQAEWQERLDKLATSVGGRYVLDGPPAGGDEK